MTLLWGNRATTFSLRFSRGAVTVAKLSLADIIEIFSVEAAGECGSVPRMGKRGRGP